MPQSRETPCIYLDQLDAQVLIMCLYLSLSALHVSNSLVHHQEQRFGAVYRNWYKPVRLARRTLSVSISKRYTIIRISPTLYDLNS